jgi:hypothetical protein
LGVRDTEPSSSDKTPIKKGKVHPKTGHEGPDGEQRYISILSLTSALELGGWSTPRSGRSTSGKETRYLLYWRLGGPQCRSGWVWKIPPHWNSVSGQSNPKRVTIPTELFRSTVNSCSGNGPKSRIKKKEKKKRRRRIKKNEKEEEEKKKRKRKEKKKEEKKQKEKKEKKRKRKHSTP